MKSALQGIGVVIALEIVAILALLIKWILAYGWTFRLSIELV